MLLRFAYDTAQLPGALRTINREGRIVMNVVTLKDIPHVPMEGAEPIQGYTGPVSRSRQTIIQPGESANYNCSVVKRRFHDGMAYSQL